MAGQERCLSRGLAKFREESSEEIKYYSATSIFLYTLEPATTGDPRWCILFSAAFVYFFLFGVTIATIICDEGSKEHTYVFRCRDDQSREGE